MYRKWLEKGETKRSIAIPYISSYGYTKQMAEQIAAGAAENAELEVNLLPLKNPNYEEVRNILEQAEGILFGVPTMEEDSAMEIRILMAHLSALRCKGKFGAAFGSYTYRPKGVINTIERMKQLNMQVLEEGLTVRFKPDSQQLQTALRFGLHFGKCVMKQELLPFPVETECETIEAVQTKRTFFIIGNGGAGITAAEWLRKRDRTCKIEIVTEENSLSYNRQMMTKGILKEIEESRMLLHPKDWYRDQKIDVFPNLRAERFDEKKREVSLSDGTVKSYDKLIVATGASQWVPEVLGIEKDGIFSVHDIASVNAMRSYIERNEIAEVVILGGGILGLETAEELRSSKFHITIMEKVPYLMYQHLDRKGAQIVKEKLEQQGVTIIEGAELYEISGKEKIRGILLNDDTFYEAQLLILCTGISENADLVSKGKPTIEVNEKMETVLPDVYSCGDCTFFKGINRGLWTQAVEMVKVAAINALGGKAHYKNVVPAVTYTGFGISLFAIGDTGKEADQEYETKEVWRPSERKDEKLYFRNERFCGGILIGNVDSATDLIQAYEERQMIDKIKNG